MPALGLRRYENRVGTVPSHDSRATLGHFRGQGTFVQPGRQPFQRLVVARSDHFHPTVGEISRAARQAQTQCLFAGGRTEEHPLHLAADPEPRRRHYVPAFAVPADSDHRFDLFGGDRTQELLGYLSFRCDQIGHGQPARRGEILGRVVDVEDGDGIAHRARLEELAHGLRLYLLVGQAHDFDIVSLFVQRRQLGHLLDAGRAPGSPEIDHHPFAAMRRKFVRGPVHRPDFQHRDLRGRLAGGRIRRGGVRHHRRRCRNRSSHRVAFARRQGKQEKRAVKHHSGFHVPLLPLFV